MRVKIIHEVTALCFYIIYVIYLHARFSIFVLCVCSFPSTSSLNRMFRANSKKHSTRVHTVHIMVLPCPHHFT